MLKKHFAFGCWFYILPELGGSPPYHYGSNGVHMSLAWRGVGHKVYDFYIFALVAIIEVYASLSYRGFIIFALQINWT